MKKNVLILILSGFLLAGLSAREITVTVTDSDLEIPLEGVKLNFKSKKNISAVTDENGNAVLNVSDSLKNESIEAKLAGYRDETVALKDNVSVIEVKMSIADVIEGQELVVNRNSPETAEEKVGVSTVLTKEKMHATANMGLVEDCMASVRTLPGVSYSGAWGSEPSVRGGEPRELAVTLDGMYTYFPWHWGGGISILNPAMIDSIKLSNGIYSAKYGKATSGLIEATTIKPDFENFHLNASVSTMTADIFAQVPFGKNVGGMLIGTHLTYLEPLFAVYKLFGTPEAEMLKRPPYIRDAFLKANFKPAPELDIAVTGFFGSDGLEIDAKDEQKGLTTRTCMDYNIYQALAGINVKYLPTDNIQLHALLSYNGMFEDLSQKIIENGRLKYNDDFVQKYSHLAGVAAGNSYALNDLSNSYIEKISSHLINGKLETDIQLNDRNIISAGVEEIVNYSNTVEDVSQWVDLSIGNDRLFKNVKWNLETEGNISLNTAAFAAWTYGNENSFLSSDFGVRAEFIRLTNPTDGFNFNFVPQVCPRATVTVTPWKDIGDIKKVSFTAGSGLFTSIPRESLLIEKKSGVSDYGLSPNVALTNVIGGNIQFEDDWNFKLETYYKYYLSRIYEYGIVDAASNYETEEIKFKSNGKAHVFGVDAMLEKNSGKVWDGYISYSFVYARFLNPAGLNDSQRGTPLSGVLDEWYYPDYHRFHTLNMVNNWHFGKGWTFTLKATLATGTPKKNVGDVSCYASKMDDGTVVQRYSRSSFYSDVLRNEISCPVDMRLAYQWLTHDEKVKWEFYIAAQDIFVNLYSPKGNKSFNSYTGEVSDTADSVDFNIGLPLPSIGMKVQF